MRMIRGTRSKDYTKHGEYRPFFSALKMAKLILRMNDEDLYCLMEDSMKEVAEAEVKFVADTLLNPEKKVIRGILHPNISLERIKFPFITFSFPDEGGVLVFNVDDSQIEIKAPFSYELYREPALSSSMNYFFSVYISNYYERYHGDVKCLFKNFEKAFAEKIGKLLPDPEDKLLFFVREKSEYGKVHLYSLVVKGITDFIKDSINIDWTKVVIEKSPQFKIEAHGEAITFWSFISKIDKMLEVVGCLR